MSDPTATPAPDTGESSKVEAAPAEAIATASDSAPPRTLFDLRKALKSAVRVLTKERSFARDVQALAEPEGDPESVAVDTPDVEATSDLKPAGLSGHTSSVAIPEVLGFLAQLRKSGTLWIWNEREQFRIQLVDGNVTFACDETPQRGWLIGEVLVSQGAMDATAFEDFLKQPREPGPLGDALIKAGLVDKQALTGAVQFQAQRVFNLAYGLNDANFCFDANRRHDDLQGIRISVTQMLFESARTRDESEQRLSTVFDDPFSK